MTINHSHIHLIGNPEENFYVLGKKDKDAFEEIYQQMSMLCARNNILAKAIKLSTEISRRLYKSNYQNDQHFIKAYAEGLQRPIEDVQFTFILPELVAAFNKWVPDLLTTIPGCSSLFVWDEKNKGVTHSRILDYALSGPFESKERSILYELPHSYKVLSYGSAGLPYASLSAMNEKGLTMALHYKHGNFFDIEGESIFSLTNFIIHHCENIREAYKFLKDKKSSSYWGIYLSDKNGEVLSLDIKGDEIYKEIFDIKDHPYLYFNNRPLLYKNEFESLRPFGNLQQCKMRKKQLKNNIGDVELSQSNDVLLNSLKTLTKASPKKATTAKNWNLSPTTLSSIQACGFHNTKLESLFIPGKAPKYFQNEYVKLTNIFSKISFKEHKSQRRTTDYIKAQQYLSEFQSLIDMGKVSAAYHKIQMALEWLKGYPEYYIAEFFFLVTQYIYEGDQRDLTYIYQQMIQLEKKLPSYLEDHRLLFVLRLGKLIGHKPENLSALVKNEELKKLYLKEYNLNSIALKGLKKFIFPRIEILDIVYTF